ncbi:MAG: hypothetical protein HYX28_06350 [Candidatus Koribacter versatilis]|uniref:Uncharacterized protein n=1 Tax=Candidatus Korobacter versatilis TaxID=658062 RepID=A0A932A7Y7_9BACT|nr:hypothetical protein [Candidatus Koribacter versatilis]
MTGEAIARHRIYIIESSDPQFDDLYHGIVKGFSNRALDLMRPYSVMLVNKNSRAVVAYVLIWEFVREDGSTFQKESRFVQEGAFLDGTVRHYSGPGSRAGVLIEGSSQRLASPMFNLAESSDLTAWADSSLRQLDRVESVQKELSQLKGISVSVDGAFFEDGTFVGPDRSGFFSAFKAEFNAKQDLLTEILADVHRGSKRQETLAKLKGIGEPASALSSDSEYEKNRKAFAKEMFATFDVGFDTGRAYAYQASYKLRPSFRKSE